MGTINGLVVMTVAVLTSGVVVMAGRIVEIGVMNMIAPNLFPVIFLLINSYFFLLPSLSFLIFKNLLVIDF